MAAPQETPAGDGIALPGISDQATATSGTGTSAGASPSSPPEPSAPGEIALPGLGTASGSSVTDNSSITTGLGRNREPEIPLPTGTRLGGFEIRRVIGRGGMATVYKATQLSLKRPVAVKVLAKRFARSPLFVDRFEQEAGALAGLNHPNIVNIIDKGVIDDNYFFVMEIVEGITLDQLLHSVELTEQHYLHIISEISKALSYVHSKGIIHRDIKPSNILINRQGVVKVGDFGIAHMTETGETMADRKGRKGTVGTAHYMSPEQATDPASVDQRADIYSLAVTFYKMFTRQLPPAGATQVTPPSEINLALPKAVDAIIARAMNPDPALRYAEVSEFCDALIGAFTSRSGSDLVGATASGAESGNSLFNTALFPSSSSSSGGSGSNFGLTAVTVPEPDLNLSASPVPSDTTAGGLLAVPLPIAGLEGADPTSGGLSTLTPPGPSLPSPLPLDQGPTFTNTFSRPEPAVAATQELDPERKRLYIILGVIATVILLAAIGVFMWWLRYSAYGSILEK